MTESTRRAVTVQDVAAFRRRGERFVMLTAYDANQAEILDSLEVPVLLVGDSLSMVTLGHESTLPVTLDEMIMHAQSVGRGAKHALIVVDLPFGSFQAGPEQALASAVRVMKETRASAVKLEGGRRIVPAVRALVEAGIPVMGHLGLTPQSVAQFGGFKVQGRDAQAADTLASDARELAEAGAFSIVLECVPASVGRHITATCGIPTIGIGAGPDTDGQVLVWHDVFGLSAGPHPRFVKAYVDLRGAIGDAVRAFTREVADGTYPAPEHTYDG